MAEDGDERAPERMVTDRRRFVQGAAALGAAGLAGCGNGNGTPSGGGTGPDTGTPPLGNQAGAVHGLPLSLALVEGAFYAEGDGDRTLRINAGRGPQAKNANWNIFADTQALDLKHGDLLHLPLGAFNRRNADIHYYLLEEVSGGVDHIDMKVRDGIKWHNGEPYTAKDLWAGNHINFISNRFFQDRDYMPNPLEGEEYMELLEDENTVRLHLKEPRRAKFFSLEFLVGGYGRRSARFSYDQISEYVDRIQDAVEDGSEDQLEKVHQEFLGAGRRDGFRLSDDEVLFHGPFKLKERQNNGVVLERNPHFPREKFIDSDETALNFETIKGRRIRNVQAEWKSLTNRELQLTTNDSIPEVVIEQRPDNIKFASNETWRGVGMNFDHTNVDFQHRAVRRAMAWAIGQEQIWRNEGRVWSEMAGRPDGIRINDAEWLGEYEDDFRAYSPKHSNYEKAAAKLREAGYTKEDGKWYRPNGERFKFTWLVRGRHNGIVKTAKQQLEDFGIKVDQETSSFSSFPDEIDTKEWGIVLNWVWMFRPHPWFAYNHAFVSEWIPRQMSYGGWHPDNGRTGEGRDGAEPGTFEVEVPPIGEWDGEPEPVNVKEIHTKIGDPSADINEKQGVQQLAWVYNYDLPKVPMLTMKRGKLYNTEGQDGDWVVTGDEDAPRRSVTRTPTWTVTESTNRTTGS